MFSAEAVNCSSGATGCFRNRRIASCRTTAIPFAVVVRGRSRYGGRRRCSAPDCFTRATGSSWREERSRQPKNGRSRRDGKLFCNGAKYSAEPATNHAGSRSSICRRKTNTRGGALWVISDFYVAPTLDELIRRWHRASFIPIRVFDKVEYRPADFRECTLFDVEDKRKISPPDNPAFVIEYRREMERFESFLNLIARRGGGELHRIECTESVEEIFLRFARAFPKGK